MPLARCSGGDWGVRYQWTLHRRCTATLRGWRSGGELQCSRAGYRFLLCERGPAGPREGAAGHRQGQLAVWIALSRGTSLTVLACLPAAMARHRAGTAKAKTHFLENDDLSSIIEPADPREAAFTATKGTGCSALPWASACSDLLT